MKIEIVKSRKNANDKTVYWVLTDDDSVEYEWWSDIPLGVDVQKYLDKKKDEYLFLIRQREYPDAPVKRIDFDFDLWVYDGKLVPAVTDSDGNEIIPAYVAVRNSWGSAHPISATDFDNAKTVADLKAAIRPVLFGE